MMVRAITTYGCFTLANLTKSPISLWTVRLYSRGSGDNGKSNRFENKFTRHEGHSGNKRPLKLDLNGFTPKARDAVRSIVDEVRQYGSLRVKYLQQGKLSDKNLVEIINNLDQSKYGINVIPNSEKQCIVRVIPVSDMIKHFTDELAKQMEEKLAEQGSRAALRAIEQRERADKKRGAAKVVQLKWTISLQDLKLQKASEIMKKVDKGEKFQIFINGDRVEHASDPEQELTNQFELKRRTHVIEALSTMLEEAQVQIASSGSNHGNMVFNCTPKETDEINDKANKKQKKQKKQRTIKQPQKINEEDLDSLYSFKVED